MHDFLAATMCRAKAANAMLRAVLPGVGSRRRDLGRCFNSARRAAPAKNGPAVVATSRSSSHDDQAAGACEHRGPRGQDALQEPDVVCRPHQGRLIHARAPKVFISWPAACRDERAPMCGPSSSMLTLAWIAGAETRAGHLHHAGCERLCCCSSARGLCFYFLAGTSAPTACGRQPVAVR